MAKPGCLSIRNATRNTVLHKNPIIAASSFSKAKGFMFSRPKDRAIIFDFPKEEYVSLHMWFVFGAIDVICLDRNNKVIALKKEFRPWSYWRIGKKSRYIIELPKGTIEKSRTVLGDSIVIG